MYVIFCSTRSLYLPHTSLYQCFCVLIKSSWNLCNRVLIEFLSHDTRSEAALWRSPCQSQRARQRADQRGSVWEKRFGTAVGSWRTADRLSRCDGWGSFRRNDQARNSTQRVPKSPLIPHHGAFEDKMGHFTQTWTSVITGSDRTWTPCAINFSYKAS